MTPRYWMTQCRVNLGLTQRALAKRATLSLTTVNGVETGRIERPSRFTAMRIAKVLQVPWTKFYED